MDLLLSYTDFTSEPVGLWNPLNYIQTDTKSHYITVTDVTWRTHIPNLYLWIIISVLTCLRKTRQLGKPWKTRRQTSVSPLKLQPFKVKYCRHFTEPRCATVSQTISCQISSGVSLLIFLAAAKVTVTSCISSIFFRWSRSVNSTCFLVILAKRKLNVNVGSSDWLHCKAAHTRFDWEAQRAAIRLRCKLKGPFPHILTTFGTFLMLQAIDFPREFYCSVWLLINSHKDCTFGPQSQLQSPS